MFTHSLQDSSHLFTLPLGPNVGADPLLQELQTSLILGDPEQLHSTFFVGGETNDFSHNVTDKLVMVGLLALVLGRTSFLFIRSGLVPFIETSANFVLRSHLKSNIQNYSLSLKTTPKNG